MQTTLFLVLMSSGLSLAYFTCNTGEVITDPESCCNYYLCYYGVPSRHDCDEGTFYSPDVQKCHSKWNVDCGTRSTEGCGSYNNDQYYNNGCDNNEDNHLGTNNNMFYWSWTEEGIMVNPLQTDCGPGYLKRELNNATEPTIDDAYQKDNYYNY